MRGLLILSVVAALALAGCGDDSGDDDAVETTTSAAEGSASESEAGATESENGAAETGETLTKEEYEERYQELGDQAEAAIGDIGEDATSIDPEDAEAIGGAFRDFAAVTEEVAGELDALQPPDDIAEEHQGYVDVLHATADAYADIAEATAEADDPEAARAELQRLQDLFSQPEISSAVKAFERAVRKGDYDLGFEPRSEPVPGATP